MSGINNDWEFLVRCYSPHLLRSLGERLTGNDMQFYTVPSEYHEGVSDDFRFNTWFCNNVTDENMAYSIGVELLSLFNGACNIIDKEHYKVELEELWKEEKRGNSTNNLAGRSIRLKGADIFAGEEEKKSHVANIENDHIFILIHLSKSRDDILHLLKAFASDLDWSRLYTILESVEKFARKIEVEIFVDDAKRELFTRTANNFAALGMDARHGDKNWEPPLNPMEINEARVFIKNITREYVLKICQLSLTSKTL